MTETGTDILKWADAAMYESQPMLKEEGARVTPRVFLLSATPDPLGCLAMDMRMYRGDPVYSSDEITDEQRTWAWEELSKTRLNTPLEGVQLKFMIEAVTRSFTHQLVRQRVGAYYVQESLRFAVKRGLADEVAKPIPVINNENAEAFWDQTVKAIEKAYDSLVNMGIPAEDARGLLPHAITTRVIYNTNLRSLFEHAGNRLCTQAQFEWRSVFMGIMQAMREFRGNDYYLPRDQRHPNDMGRSVRNDSWQWEIIATPTPMTFAPVCYKTGKCEWMSKLDRGCTIRDRVEFNHRMGIEPARWAEPVKVATPTGPQVSVSIDPAEWMANPYAGLTTEDNRPT
jgi:flavin-dependent thymidylate synthase